MKRFCVDPEEPFRTALRPRWMPDEMVNALELDETIRPVGRELRYALLINPFYPKDAHASFGKHVLTPTLALTSVAGTTPPGWRVEYWDENLLRGPPPGEPMPAVVGITVHLTFARRAYELARWYRARGATVILGGLHVLSNPDEAKPHADAIVIGDGVQLWPRILCDFESGQLQPAYTAMYENEYRGAAPFTRACRQLSHHREPDCHARMTVTGCRYRMREGRLRPDLR